MYIASENGHVEVVKILIDAGADATSLMRIACQGGYLKIVTVLVAVCIDVNRVFKDVSKFLQSKSSIVACP